jgi:hypothetical protein
MTGGPCTTSDCTGTFLADGFCDTCGVGASAASPAPAQAPAAPATLEATLTSAGESGEVCPDCGTARDAGSSFCEACGHPFVAGRSRPVAPAAAPATDAAASVAPAAPADPAAPASTPAAGTWEAVVATDARWYSLFCEAWAKNGQGPCPIPFPGDTSRTVAMAGSVVIVGRHADGIDVAEDPDDPAASHRHASLTLQPGGQWLLTDLASSNGTYLDDVPLGDGESRLLDAGASFHVGAFTRVTVNRVVT